MFLKFVQENSIVWATTMLSKLFKVSQVRSYRIALIRHHTAAGVEHSKLLRYLSQQNFQTIVDIGANRGQFALVARACFPQARVYSFEPLKEPAAIFKRVFESDEKVVLHQLAIGPEDKEMPIHISRADDSSSLLPISPLQSKLFPGTEEKEQQLVIVRQLNTVLCWEDIARPALLKIDVQGFERYALEGCKPLLPCFSHVYVECSFMKLYEGQALADEVIRFLQQFGFHLSGIYNLSYDRNGIAIQGDFLFEIKNY